MLSISCSRVRWSAWLWSNALAGSPLPIRLSSVPSSIVMTLKVIRMQILRGFGLRYSRAW